ncbi:patatin-like phospholipase family protein [Lewinella sp. IMCC34183]|uniref:patatin-like phospholipase family protein n=1 Tax=Lewinella sp. IMCC34183 TaxID=2248762 RepID=UPI000E22499D|nr:patatin-like phospholipase family protein [Lewinella sp. IMCC34183]
MRKVLHNVYRSFPVQLLLLHLRSHYLLLALWTLLLLMMTGVLGPRLGMQYLFLDPEYLGRTGYLPFLIVGLAYGFFVMTWNLSTYLLLGGYFNFLASLARPFFKFCLNNALLPLAFLLVYCGLLIHFYRLAEGAGTQVLEAITGLVTGLAASLFMYAIYFNLTNRDILYYTGYRDLPPNQGPSSPEDRSYRPYRGTPLGPELVDRYDNPFRVRFYLNADVRVQRVRSVSHYDTALLRNIFRQNHFNALILQAASIAILVVLGLLVDRPAFQLPAGASFFILFSLFVSTIGAISYWFSAWRLPLLTLLLLLVNWLTSTSLFDHGNEAYGLNYTRRATYSLDTLRALYAPDTLRADIAATTGILDRWRAKQASPKPKLVILCASGGGLTAALWATHLTQSIEACSEGRLLNQTALITGASGGLLGLAYLRESYLHDPGFSGKDLVRLERVATDLLNPTAFSIVSNDIFLPFRRVEVGGRSYRRDRGYAFERAYNRATDYLLDRPLAAYREQERTARVPLLFVTPSVVEDGRRMVISPQGVSYMMAPPVPQRRGVPLLPDMVDFGRFLRAEDADSLRLSTALRANASYPYVLPQVNLPTRPQVRLMDAGYRDNYGITSATRFVHVFEDWIAENTSGVVLVQISAFREQTIADDGRRGVITGLFSPLGVAGNILGLQILDQEELLAELYRTLGPDRFHLFRFNYQPKAGDPLRTSVSLHLTDFEKTQVLRAIDEPYHQRQIDELLQLLSY